jgi:hypothetical protein
VGDLQGMRPLAKPRRTLEYNIKIKLKEIERGGTDWIHMAQDY